MTPRLLTPVVLNQFPLPMPAGNSDKNSRGTVLAIAGSLRVPGAAILAGTSVLRAGAGKIQLVLPRSIALSVGTAFLECGVVPLEENGTGDSLAVSSPDFIKAINVADVILIGPGIMDATEASGFVRLALENSDNQRFVLDALALCQIRKNIPLLIKHSNNVIVTPHHGEMAAMMGISKEEIDIEPLKYALQAAAELGVVVVLKGNKTLIAMPSGDAWVHEDDMPELATAGSGDVLAGILSGLLARGTPTLDAALWSVVLHAQAGHMIARTIGGLGLIARELPAAIPTLLAKFGRYD